MQADERARHMVVHCAVLWGWRDPCNTYSARLRIAKAACRLVAYDFGYPKPLAHTQLPYWVGKINDAIVSGESADPVSPVYCGSSKYVKTIEDNNPGYLHELFRYAQQVKGSIGTFSELKEVMNEKSSAPGENRPTLSLSRRQLSDWFRVNGGKEMSAVEKPRLTDEHKQMRREWAVEHFDKFVDRDCPKAFLDEKWFYTTSRRKTLKNLPKGEMEAGDPIYKRPTIRSRRFPVKVMFLGVVACPNEDRGFDGRIFLKRISERRATTRMSRNRRFSVDVVVNEDIIGGGWKRLVVDGMSTSELVEAISEHYDLDEFVAERLQVLYNTFTRGGNKKIQVLTAEQRIGELGFRTNEEGEQIQIGLDDLDVFVCVQRGDMLDEDCSCDSQFMLRTIPEVGQAMRESFHWVPLDQKIYLFMDNAGGHGTDDAKAQYIQALQIFNIEVVWQVP